MRISASGLGWCVFLAAIVGACLRTQDDPLTAAMKSSGTYRPVLIGMGMFIGLMVIRLGFMMRQTARMGRQLEELRNKKGGR